MPRSVYCPLRHMSHSPTAQFGHGTGSGRRTIPTTRSPGRRPLPGPASTTRPSDSWPRTSRSRPGGAQPYAPEAISTSVPQMPTATASTRIDPVLSSGSGTSSKRTDPATPGLTVTAFMIPLHDLAGCRARAAAPELRQCCLCGRPAASPWLPDGAYRGMIGALPCAGRAELAIEVGRLVTRRAVTDEAVMRRRLRRAERPHEGPGQVDDGTAEISERDAARAERLDRLLQSPG